VHEDGPVTRTVVHRPKGDVALRATAAASAVAVLAPIVFAFAAFWSMFGLANAPPPAERAIVSLVLSTLGVLAAAAGAVVAVVTARAAGRAIATFYAWVAVLGGLFFGGVCGLLVLADVLYLERQVADEAAQQEEETFEPGPSPECGVDAAPIMSDQGPRFVLCQGGYDAANELIPRLISDLPIDDVTVERVQAMAADGQLPDGLASAGLFNGVPAAVWMPTDYTCVNATWGGTAWMFEVVGVRMDGGCLLYDGQWSPGA
jgi:hypothetical protein